MTATTTRSEDGPSFTAFLEDLYGRLLSPDFVANLVKENKLDVKFFLRSKDVLFSFEDVSDAAEDKQLQDPAVKKWFDRIKDAFFVVDNLLNQIATKSEPVEEVSNFKILIHKLESILEHKDFFGLKQISSVDLSYRTPTSIVERHNGIYGESMAAITSEDRPSFTTFLADLNRRLLLPDFFVNLTEKNKLDYMFLQGARNALFFFEEVYAAAENEQLQDPAVKKWFDPIKDDIYVADDLLNQIATKSEPLEEVSLLKGIIHRLESILEHEDFLALKQISNVDLSYRTPTSLVEGNCRIYGRDADKKAIMELLLTDTSDGNISVIPIVGKGGVGKTTLAHMVYNDDNLKPRFDIRAWVCVGEEFDFREITKTMIEAVTSSPCNTDESLNSLQRHLKEKLSGKKFFLVLDNMWNESMSSDNLNVLLNPFQNRTKGSKILVTTRNTMVASSLVQTGGEVYELMRLSDEDCWLLFAERTSLSSRSSITSTREAIGREMAYKCRGLPLKVQILGGLLLKNYNIEDWNDIMESDVWMLSESRDFTPALLIIYYYLPAHLKRCFASCSSYPKHYKFDKDELISFWMAQGLLQSSNSEKTLEEIGDEYFHDLVSRSFLQHWNLDGSYGSFVMHDLIHDFATFKAKELGTFLPLNLEDLSTTILSTSRGTHWIQILPFPPLTLPTISSLSVFQHQWMVSIRIRNLRLQIELWRLAGFVSGVIGMLCLALSPSFSHLIGGWNSFKFFIYGVVIFIICITTMFAKKCTLSRHRNLKAHVGFTVLILTFLYSFWHDKAVNRKPDLWSMISNGAFALMSLSLSRVLKLGFEEGLFAFFLSCLVVQLVTIKLVLIFVAIIFGYPIYFIHSSSNTDSDYLPSMVILDE